MAGPDDEAVYAETAYALTGIRVARADGVREAYQAGWRPSTSPTSWCGWR